MKSCRGRLLLVPDTTSVTKREGVWGGTVSTDTGLTGLVALVSRDRNVCGSQGSPGLGTRGWSTRGPPPTRPICPGFSPRTTSGWGARGQDRSPDDEYDPFSRYPSNDVVGGFRRTFGCRGRCHWVGTRTQFVPVWPVGGLRSEGGPETGEGTLRNPKFWATRLGRPRTRGSSWDVSQEERPETRRSHPQSWKPWGVTRTSQTNDVCLRYFGGRDPSSTRSSLSSRVLLTPHEVILRTNYL